MRKEFRSLISLEEARSIVFSHLPRSSEEIVPLESARGRILSRKILSLVDVPGFNRASMDGYAVRSEDTLESREDRPVSLRLAGSVLMGVLPDLEVAHGEAAEVSTGSMMPQGADAVVMIEYSQPEGGLVQVRRAVHAGENVQAAGSDISLGEAVMFPGTGLNEREIGILAALGHEAVKVRSLKVGVASTGNELVPPGQPLPAGRIYDINSYTIAAAVAECGATAARYGILPDKRETLAKTLQEMAERCDMLLVSGSTSAGAGDMVFRVLEEIGELIFHGVNLKPGKPTIFGLVNDKPLLGLPGYPTSALTVFSCLADPAIRLALGQRHRKRCAKGRLSRPLRTEGRRQMLAVGIRGELVYPVDKGSGSITTLAGADGIIDIPAGVEFLEQGETVKVELFGEASAPKIILAGENSFILEKLAESLPWPMRFLNTGSNAGRIYLEDGLADLVCVSGFIDVPVGMTSLKSFRRELGLIFKDEGTLSDPRKRIVGWHRDSAMKSLFERILHDCGLFHPKYVRAARTHSAVAAAINSGLADAGFGERAAADEAGLGFKLLAEDEMQFLKKTGAPDNPWINFFVSALSKLEEI